MAQTNVRNVTRDVLASDRPAYDPPAQVAGGVTREILTGDRLGVTWPADVLHVSRDMLTGDRVGRNTYADVLSLVREIVIAEPAVRAMVVEREVLAAFDNEQLSVQRNVTGFRQAVAMVRPPMPLPSTVKSPHFVASLRETAVLHAVRTWARSTDYAGTLRMQVMQHRFAPPPHSTITATTLRTMVTISRGKAYVPVSEIRIKRLGEQVAQRRNFAPPSAARTPNYAGSLCMQTVMSRKTGSVIITTDADVFTLRRQILMASGKRAPHSTSSTATLVSLAVQRHNVAPPNSGENVVQHFQQAVMHRTPKEQFSRDIAGSFSELVAQRRDFPKPPHSDESAGTLRESVVMKRETFPPNAALGRHSRTLRMQALQHRVLPVHHSFTSVGSLVIRFTLGRTTPKPWDVIDPAIGRHAASLRMMTVQHRVTEPPVDINANSRYVYELLSQVTVRDKFPLPDYPVEDHETDVYMVAEHFVASDLGGWEPVSAVTVAQAIEQLALADDAGWVDPTIPVSDLSAFSVVQPVAVGDSFVDPLVPASDAMLSSVGEQVAVVTDFPDPSVPQSVLQVEQVGQQAAVGDAGFPDPSIPTSEVRSMLVAASALVGDTFAPPSDASSDVNALTVGELVAVSDKTMWRLPDRAGRRRPAVSVSIL